MNLRMVAGIISLVLAVLAALGVIPAGSITTAGILALIAGSYLL